MMKRIRHFPCGINPYGSCGYDRVPFRPVQGQKVEIRCKISENCGNPSLRLQSDLGEQILAGVPDPMFEKGCFLFSAGRFCAGEQVAYTLFVQEEETESYQFVVRRIASIEQCKKLWVREDKAFLSCTVEDGTPFTMEVSPAETGFTFAACQKDMEEEIDGREYCTLKTEAGYQLELKYSPFQMTLLNPQGKALISFDSISFELDETDKINRFHLEFLAAGKGFYGFGEKYDRINQKGLSPKNVVYEHFTHQGKHTYLPTPWFFTETGWGIYCATNCEMDFDLSEERDTRTLLKISGETGTMGLPNLHLLTGLPTELLKSYQKLTGPCGLPPKWAFGPWVSANGWGTQKETMEQAERMRQEHIPATVLVLEAWSDETTFYIFNGAQYQPKLGGEFSYSDFNFNPNGPWPDPKHMVEALQNSGLHLVLWQIPIIKKACENNSEQLTIDEKEAVERGYCVKNPDGTPYRIPDNWFAGCLVLDFTNPEAVNWWFAKRRYLRDELHIEGFKTDGGEFIYDPATRFYNGKTGADMRNPYPEAYSNAYYSFLQQGEKKGVTFSRAGYVGTQRSPMLWAGDQISTFEEMRAQLRAGLSAGLSGIPFWGFDLAGFAGDLPSTELYLRAAGMAAFSPIMQFHSEPRSGQFGDSNRRSWVNDRSPWNISKVNNAPEILDVYRKYSNLRMKLLPYIFEEAKCCVSTGRPLLCHLVYDYPDDENVLNLEDEYLFGRSLLVAPVFDEGIRKRSVYLPAGEWYDFWTGNCIAGGGSVEIPCPLDSIPVFIRSGAPGMDSSIREELFR